MSDPKSRVIAAVGLLADIAQCDLFDNCHHRGNRPGHRAVVERQIEMALEPRKRNQWALIESIVVFDEVVYDRYAFHRFPMDLKERARLESLEGNGLRAMNWPKEIYQATAKKLQSLRQLFSVQGMEAAARQVADDQSRPYDSTNDAFWDAQEKRYHDGLYADHELSQWSFAASEGSSLERAFFYAELGNQLGVGLLPRAYAAGDNAEQISILNEMARSYSRCAHHHYIQRSLKPFDDQVRPATLAVIFPPLAQKIARISLETGRSPTDVAVEMRDTANARAYRRHLADLQYELRSANPSTAEALPKLVKDFDTVVKQWVEDGTAGSGVTYKRRTLRAQLLPAIAGVIAALITREPDSALKAAEATHLFLEPLMPDDKVVRDPILWGGERYLAFVADWYRK